MSNDSSQSGETTRSSVSAARDDASVDCPRGDSVECDSNRDAHDLLEQDVDLAVYKDLQGVNVFITGGGSGIGAYLVAAFSLQGANVGFVSLNDKTAHSLCDRVAARCKGRQPHYYPCDIRDIVALKHSIDSFQAQFGAIGVLINNAARDTRHDVETYTVEEWDDALNTNLRPHFFTTQSVAGWMRCSGGGSIINVGSNCSLLGLAGYPAYVASKAAIHGLTRALARELGSAGIRVNSLIPGWVMTERQRLLWVNEESLQACIDAQSLKSTISGIDIAQAALFLGSRASSMMTGQALVVDGGRA